MVCLMLPGMAFSEDGDSVEAAEDAAVEVDDSHGASGTDGATDGDAVRQLTTHRTVLVRTPCSSVPSSG